MIVVGVDGSEPARDALAWALAQARLRGSSVRVVCAWSIAMPVYSGMGLAVAGVPELEESFQLAAEQTLRETLASLTDEARGLRIETSAVGGMPARVLVDAAQGAELLVVGSRGHGGFTGLLLGSVSQQCAQHAPCPVVVVKDEPRGAAQDEPHRT
jgi:nucleotide-binding universal stress UspA family protein